MSIPNFQVFASLQRLSPEQFILDDATDGVLDTSMLGGFITVDEPLNVPVLSVSVQRGRSRQLDRFTSGTATIVFDNRGRELDPLNTDSLFESLIVPRVVLKITADNVPIYVGYVTDWEIDYDPIGNDRATAVLADVFSLLANQIFDENVTPDREDPGPRMQWVLDYFNYLGDTDFDNGFASLGSFEIEQKTNVLDYLFNVANSDRGYFFTSRQGVLTFVNKLGREDSGSLVFSDDGSGVGYKTLNSEYSDDSLFNSILVSSPAGQVIKQNAASIADYGLFSLTFDKLLNYSLVDLDDLAFSYLNFFSEPVVRFTGVGVELAGFSEEARQELLRLELASVVTFIKSFSVGDPLLISKTFFVTGIKHQVSPSSHFIQFSFDPSPFGNLDLLKLDDVLNGILDTNQIG
jgi:hypothetical protein